MYRIFAVFDCFRAGILSKGSESRTRSVPNYSATCFCEVTSQRRKPQELSQMLKLQMQPTSREEYSHISIL